MHAITKNRANIWFAFTALPELVHLSRLHGGHWQFSVHSQSFVTWYMIYCYFITVCVCCVFVSLKTKVPFYKMVFFSDCAVYFPTVQCPVNTGVTQYYHICESSPTFIENSILAVDWTGDTALLHNNSIKQRCRQLTPVWSGGGHS